MLKEESEKLGVNDQYEGFGIDIIEELSQLYGFKYNFTLVTGTYGSENQTTKEWK